MNPRTLISILIPFAILSACSKQKTSPSFVIDTNSSIAAAPAIADSDRVKTVAAYIEACESARKALPKSLTEISGPNRLISATRALAACKSEAARAYARALIGLLKTYKLEAGPVPSTGNATVTYAELAKVDALSQALMRGPESKDQGPAPAGPDTIPYSLHMQMLVLISRDAPSETASVAAAFNTTNPLPADVSLDGRLSSAQARQLFIQAWANLRGHFTDPARPVNLTCAQVSSSSDVFLYALYYAGNAIAAAPKLSPTGHELRDLADGYIRIGKAVKALDLTVNPEEDPPQKSLDELRNFAGIMDSNIAITREAQSDVVRFFNAIAANDDVTVKALSSNAKSQTAAQWRDWFSFDLPDPVKSLEVLGLGITESPGRISVTLKKSDAAGKVETDQQYVTVRKQNGHWLIIEG